MCVRLWHHDDSPGMLRNILGLGGSRGGGSWVLTLSFVPGKSEMAIGLLRNTGMDLIQKQFDHKGPDV